MTRLSLALGLNLQTHTPVRKITPGLTSRPDMPTYRVHTDRGVITTPTIVHATNAFAATLLPQLDDILTPTPFVCTKVVPPPAYSGRAALQNTYAVMVKDGALFSINPRTSSDGAILFGGDGPAQHQLTKLLTENPKRWGDDRLGNFQPIAEAVRDLIQTQFTGWGPDDEMAVGEGVQYNWSGSKQ